MFGGGSGGWAAQGTIVTSSFTFSQSATRRPSATSTVIDFTNSTQQLLTHPNRLTFKYAKMVYNDYKNFTKKDFQKFNTHIIKNQGSVIDINNFINWVSSEDEKLTLDIEEINQDWLYIENRIIAEIANSLSDKNSYYHILLNQDNQFLTAIENLDKAKLLID